MANTLLRTGRSGVLNTARDFSCCVVTADHELISAAECYPIHVLRGPDLMSQAMMRFNPVLRRGDAFLHNSPYHGNSHAADHTILVPVIDDDGEHHFTVIVKAHQADCGNSIPTTYMGTARDVFQEGALIFPAVKIQQDYRDMEDIVRMCQMRIRVPDQWRGDCLAMVGAARVGEHELLKIGGEVGWRNLHAYVQQWFDYSEDRMIAAIRRLKSGRATAWAAHDPVAGTPPEGIRIKAKVEIESEEARINVDLQDNPDNMPCGLNLSQACALSAAMVGVFNAVGNEVPPNAGSYRRVRVLLREGCVVGIPRHPTSCSVATTNLGDRVTCAVQRAFVDIDERIGLADGGAAIPPASGVISGKDPRANGATFCNEIILAAGTGPGSPSNDGWLTMLTMGNAGVPFLDSIEVDEIHHPIRVTERRIIPDSEGAGRHRGAPGLRVVFGPVDCTIEVGYVSDGTIYPARGACGGMSAEPAQQFKRTRSGDLIPTPISAQVGLEPGELMVSLTAGGGGFGSPLDRNAQSVAKDVREGWVSPQRAADVYGVIIGKDGRLGEAEIRVRRRRALTARDNPHNATALQGVTR